MSNILSFNKHKAMRSIPDEIRTILALSGAHLVEGESSRDYLCPFCNGGQGNEKAFSLTKRDGNVLFICYRASCGRSGVISPNGSLTSGPVEPKPQIEEKKPRAFDGHLQKPLLHTMQMLATSYGLSENEVDKAGIMWAPESDSLAVPVRSPTGRVRGHMLRGASSSRLKWDSYQAAVNEPWLAWYTRHNPAPGPVVIVEDQFSAIKVSRYFPSVALLGTNFSLDKLLEIAENSMPTAQKVLALDRDAYEKSVQYLHKWKFYMEGNFRAIHLSKDLKYCTEAEIINTINLGGWAP